MVSVSTSVSTPDLPTAPEANGGEETRRRLRLHRADGLAAVGLAGILLSACFHVGEAATVNPNGSSVEVLTVTLSPAFASLAHVNPSQEISQLKAQARHFPGQVSVAPYKDPSGWKGLKAVIKLSNLAELKRLETTSGSSGGTPTFSTFSLTHRGGTWTLLARLGKEDSLSGGSSSQTNPLSGVFSKKVLEAMGMRVVFSFKLPGRPVSSNATSTSSNGTLSWSLLSMKGAVLKATWAG